MALGERFIPQIARVGVSQEGPPIILEAVTSGGLHYLRFSYNHPFPLPYSIGVISPIRGRADTPWEIFTSVKGALGDSTWEAWIPAVFPSVEVRLGIGAPLEIEVARLVVEFFEEGMVPNPPIAFLEAYLGESNVPKQLPAEITRFFVPTLSREKPLWMTLWQETLWQGVYFYNFSVVNNLLIPLTFYSLEIVKEGLLKASVIDRQFWFSRDEQMLVIDPEDMPLEVVLSIVPPILGLAALIGRHSVGPRGIFNLNSKEVDRVTLPLALP